jgi:glutaredoxin
MWCDRAKELLQDKNIDFVFKNIEESKVFLADFKFYFEGATTVPKILLRTSGESDHEYTVIGGYKELYEWLKSQ